jgi:hypothetical protein
MQSDQSIHLQLASRRRQPLLRCSIAMPSVSPLRALVKVVQVGRWAIRCPLPDSLFDRLPNWGSTCLIASTTVTAGRLQAVRAAPPAFAQPRRLRLPPEFRRRCRQRLDCDARGPRHATRLVELSGREGHGISSGVAASPPRHVERGLKCTDFVDGVVGRSNALARLLQHARHRSAGPFLRRVLLSRRSSVLCPAPTPSAPPRLSVYR